jgi:serine phosphatase RsbU (regulator of sigma subunit)
MDRHHEDLCAVFGRFMAVTHLMGAHDLPTHVSRAGSELGFVDVALYVADLQQRVLVPFLPPEGPDVDERPSLLAVDATLAGRAYQHLETFTHDDEAGRVQAWVPLLNGTERLGVMAVTLERDAELDDRARGRMSHLATLVGELLATKTVYGDTLVRLRRTARMGLAAEIQWSLLPPLTFANHDVSVAAALEPAYTVAGDSVDYAVDAGVARFAVFDGVGHELLSAQLVGLVVAAYRNARRTGQTLVEAAQQINWAVTGVFPGEGFVTGLLSELDTATGSFSWVSAGHLPPLLLRHGQLVKTLELAPVLPFGLGLDDVLMRTGVEELSPAVHVGTEQLEPGDYVLLYTDGVIEARSPDGELFGIPRLTDLMIRNLAAGFPASETMRRAVLALLEHQSGDLADDATMLLLQWRPEHPDPLLP